jgi:hypothetical protein
MINKESEKDILLKRSAGLRKVEKIVHKRAGDSFLELISIAISISNDSGVKEKINIEKLKQKILGRKNLIKLFAKK